MDRAPPLNRARVSFIMERVTGIVSESCEKWTVRGA